MQQIAEWLEKLGMSEYAERFVENGIDVSVLRYLTDQDHCRAFKFRPSISAIHADNLEAPKHCRAAPSHRDVLGPRRFDGTLGTYGPGGFA
jgi:hypothetical protein